MNFSIDKLNKVSYSPMTDLSGGGHLAAASEDRGIFAEAKKTSPTGMDEKKNQQKYWAAVMKIAPYRDEVYNKISQLTGINDYKNFPPEAKLIAGKMNDFCNNMASGKMVAAMSSSDIDKELKALIEEVKKYKEECINELNKLYGKDDDKSQNPFKQKDKSSDV